VSSVTHVSSRARFTRPCLFDDVGVARNFCWDRPDNRGAVDRDAESVEGESALPQPIRRPGERRKGRKRVLVYLELERAHLTATNSIFLTFVRHIFSHIHY